MGGGACGTGGVTGSGCGGSTGLSGPGPPPEETENRQWDELNLFYLET